MPNLSLSMRHAPRAPHRRHHQQAASVESPGHVLGRGPACLWRARRRAAQDVHSNNERRARASSSATILSHRSRMRGEKRIGGSPIRAGNRRRRKRQRAGEVVKKFIDIHHAQSRPRSRKEQERLLTKHFLSKYKEVPLNRITTKDILAVTDGLKELPSEQLHVSSRAEDAVHVGAQAGDDRSRRRSKVLSGRTSRSTGIACSPTRSSSRSIAPRKNSAIRSGTSF